MKYHPINLDPYDNKYHSKALSNNQYWPQPKPRAERNSIKTVK